ncbi:MULTISPECIES: hypothetical protein [unclassified Streptomyces]|uniref:hypothetical protein n=1 Tax=unclassified Streptomyces TaxID=2593676 RepID=UPI000889FAB1|nr:MULTISPECIES: hypothetical protein [unclassified Streptomyces]PBC72265.1 hypothetical protein BX261_7349 [Streptomyces sp. 2321.6]SDR61912.1 hypothetical protein SAMN05216511_7220 [Streptomyces sp. KS_16]SEE48852.1 hypothetical protein SAMN05428940_7269 [Streptomyces sp. 2133.1]SNC77770.1 hypothetical protein SAMN06272741_7186 [Streptomyces sp. 2114.4]
MADITYKQLKAAVEGLAKEVTRASDAIRGKAQQIDEEAKDTARIAEMIAGMGVDTATVGETRDLSRLMNGVSEAAIAYASAGGNTAKSANAAAIQAHTTHGGIQEAFARAALDMSHLDREWLRQG